MSIREAFIKKKYVTFVSLGSDPLLPLFSGKCNKKLKKKGF